MTIVITGATGHLGRLTLDALLAKGVAPSDIVAGGRSTDKLADFAARGVTVVPLDYTKPETLDAAFAGAEQVLLISASEPGQRFAQHSAVVDAAKRAGVAHLAYTSILHADTTEHVLAPDHKATEQLIAESGIPATFLRNGWYTENFTSSAAQAIQSGEIVASVGDGRVASASRQDYAEAAAIVLTDPSSRGKTYELSGDTAWNHHELAAAVAEIARRPVVYRDVTPQEHGEILSGFGLDAGTVGFVVALDQNTKAGLLDSTTGELAALIGRPTTLLVDGLRADLALQSA
ncbi:MAG: SDR family oxidoreductase [Pseudolysinimonas sp.]